MCEKDTVIVVAVLASILLSMLSVSVYHIAVQSQCTVQNIQNENLPEYTRRNPDASSLS